jgi:hypothetical protein
VCVVREKKDLNNCREIEIVVERDQLFEKTPPSINFPNSSCPRSIFSNGKTTTTTTANQFRHLVSHITSEDTAQKYQFPEKTLQAHSHHHNAEAFYMCLNAATHFLYFHFFRSHFFFNVKCSCRNISLKSMTIALTLFRISFSTPFAAAA